jgi:polysaccharide biosynthesis protein PslH
VHAPARLTCIQVRVLFLSPRDSWPPNSGAKLRDYHFSRALASRFQLTYVFFADSSRRSDLSSHLQAEKVVAVPAPAKYTSGKIVRGMMGKPLPIENYTSPEMTRTIRTLLGSQQFDLIHMDSMHLAAYVPLFKELAPNACTILDWHNIESEAMIRYAATTHSQLKRLYAGITARQLEGVESSLLKACFAHVVCSTREENVLKQREPDARIAVMENGVDTEYFRPDTGRKPHNRLVFVGQMSYHANADGIAWFVREIWPALRAQFPELMLDIVGSNPTPAVRALGSAGGISVTGTVADVRPYYRKAVAAIVPLLTGGGTRLKILEAMAAGTPVISTALGAEGLSVQPGLDVLIAGDSPAAWVKAVALLTKDDSRAEIATRARHTVCSHYDWTSIGRKLCDACEAWSRRS